ncbi:kinesin-like protein KIF20A [Dendronephthya gigantea]|uniref:kinesin-like protein KIF20A n=1 Tax=Dendronephthya gigantea TaxID=151771 RepID=UPI0010691FC4|nr:kinesin-like protein KIF20A [Dendronephthya gigantea]
MTHLVEIGESIVENIGDEDNNFTEIRKKLLNDFDTAETVRKVLKSSKTGNSKEPIKVYLRIKPLTGDEIEAGESQGCLEMENMRTVALHPPKTSFTFKHQSRNAITSETIQRFTFSRVFGPETGQKRFFEDTSLDVVRDFINGHNCLVFSYGITNAGKTYTILGNQQNVGILPRTFKILFKSFKDQNYEHSNLKPKMFCDVVKLSSLQEENEESKKKNLLLLGDVPTYHQSISTSDLSLQDSVEEQHSGDTIDVSSLLDVTSIPIEDQGPIQFSVWISFAEIYNEYIYDLLEPISMNKETRRRTPLKVGDDREGNPYIKGLTEIHVNNAEEAYKLLKIGRKNQKIASTKLNQNSSRSHCIFTLKILRVFHTKEPRVARVSRLSFVDLAGSERYTKTQNTGARLKEAGNINTSIMTLGKCVELLRYNQNHVNNQKNIPFRESKLTRLFQGFFCGKGKASMIVNVNQCASAFDETLHALKFSAIAKKVTTIAHGPQQPVEIHNRPLQVSARSNRSSVAWADGSVSTPVGNKVNLQTDDNDATVSEEDTANITPLAGSKDLVKVIAELEVLLKEERKEKLMMEMKIREEVCQEMAEQLVEIERNYNERMEEEQRATEELYEKRLDILSKSVKKARKRPRFDLVEDEDDEWVSSVVLHREEMKNKDLSERIVVLEQKLASLGEERGTMIDNVATLGKEKDEIIENLRKELQSRDENIKAFLEKATVDEEEKLVAEQKLQEETKMIKEQKENNLVKQLEKRLQESTAALDKKNSQLISKNNAITKLENSLKINRADLSAKEEELKELRTKIEQQQSNLLNKSQEKMEIVENLKFVEGELLIMSSKEKETQVEMGEFMKELNKAKDDAGKWELEVKRLQQTEEILKTVEGRVEELKKVIGSKEEDFISLKQDFDKALDDLANVQTRVVERNEKLEEMEILVCSLKNESRCKEAEVARLQKELTNARDELRNIKETKDEGLEQVKQEMEKTDVCLKHYEVDIERLKNGLEESNQVVEQMEKDLTSKEKENMSLISQLEKLLQNEEKMKELTRENDCLDGQCERFKIKIFELETEVEKLQQDVKKETTKKDTATAALRDGLEIVKAKKQEFEARMNEAEKEKEEIKNGFEMKIADLREEIARLSSASSESGGKTDPSDMEGDDDSSNGDYVYKPVKVESFNMPGKDRMEIDVTPITGTGLPKGSKKTTKSLKRKSSDMTLREIQQDFAKTKLRKTRSSVSGRSRPSKANMTASTFSLTTLDEDSENAHPKTKSGRKFLNMLPFPEGIIKSKTSTDSKNRTRKLFKKTEISAPLDSPNPVMADHVGTPTTARAQDVIMRRLRSRVIKVAK